MLAAGDTFRAAAIDQLKIWGERTGAERHRRATSAPTPPGLAFDALKQARENGSDVLLIDTAGRLQNKQALMDELEKVIRVLRKLDRQRPASTCCWCSMPPPARTRLTRSKSSRRAPA